MHNARHVPGEQRSGRRDPGQLWLPQRRGKGAAPVRIRLTLGAVAAIACLLLGSCDRGRGGDGLAPEAGPGRQDPVSWPGAAAVRFVDDPAAALGANTSGLAYQPASASGPGYLWVVKNAPPQLHKLAFDAGAGRWRRQGFWPLATPGGAIPDTEGITGADWGSPLVYIVSERENNGPGKPSIIAWDTSRGAAVRQWDLTHDEANPQTLPVVGGSNNGLEALAWIPDQDLLSYGYFDERLGKPYDPADYPGHGTGLFVAGLEMNGQLYVYALGLEDGSFFRVATMRSGFPNVMGLEYDRDTGYLWAHCDDTCGNLTGILRIDVAEDSPTRGRFVPLSVLRRPDGLVNSNHEGIAILPASECEGGARGFIWGDDSGRPGRSLSAGTIPCGSLLPKIP